MGLTNARDVAFLAFFFTASTTLAFASDSIPLQSFCVGTNDPVNAVHINGRTCKNPAEVTPEDFYFKGINRNDGGGNVQGQNINATQVDATNLPVLNTLGVSMMWADFGPGGVAPPHFHPRATEVITILNGTLQVGIFASDKVLTKVLHPGDVFVVPQRVVHYERNVKEEHAALVAGFSSDNPGLVRVASPSLPPAA